MNDLELSALSTSPVPALASPSDIKARGDQRRTRGRVALAGAAALVVLAGAGTAVALAGGGKPDALVPAGPTPTPTGSWAPAPTGEQPDITWAAFPSVTRMPALVPGDWVSSQVHEQAVQNEYERCDVTQTKLRRDQRRAIVGRTMSTTDNRVYLSFSVEDYASADAAARVLAERLAEIRQCPTVVTDGPGAGSQETSTILSSSADSYTVDDVQRECQGDHTQCADTPSRSTTTRAGHLLLTVGRFRPVASITDPQAQAVLAEFVQRATSSYGKPATQPPTANSVSPSVGGTYYAAFVWSGDKDALPEPGMEPDGDTYDEAKARAEAWGTVTEAPIPCLHGELPSDDPGVQDGIALAMLYDDAASAERFVNGYSGRVGFVEKITLRCLS
jgi:hypothetical protein